MNTIPFTADDVRRIEALQPDDWDDIRGYFRFYGSSSFCRPLKIEVDGEILAVGAVVLHGETAWLAHIIVDPGHRREGLGEKMTRDLMACARGLERETLLLIATDMGAPLYERLGFRRSCEYHFYDPKTPETSPVPSGVRPLRPGDAQAVIDLDRRVTGEDRRLLLTGHLERGWVVDGKGAGNLAGSFLPDLGEGVVIAECACAGEALLSVRLGETAVRPVLPAANEAGNAFLAGRGYTVNHSAWRMNLGGEDPLKPAMLFNRVGGHLG